MQVDKMVYNKLVFALALVASVSARPEPFLDLGGILGGFGGAAGGAFGLVNTTGQVATGLLNQGVQSVAGTANQLVGTVAGLGSNVLNGATGALEGGIDALTNVASVIPGLGGLFSLGGGILKTGLNVANSLGQTGLGIGSGIAGTLTQGVSSIGNAGAGILSGGISAGTGLANAGVQGVLGSFGNLAGSFSG